MKRFVCISLVLFIGALSALPQEDSNFTLWQLPSQINTIGNSYVFQMNNGKVVVMDGGVKAEAEFLKGSSLRCTLGVSPNVQRRLDPFYFLNNALRA